MTKIKIFTLALLSVCAFSLSAKDYKASMFGVKSDGTILNTNSIQRAVDFISENGGGRLVFYVGRYLTGSIHLKSNVVIQLEEGAVLVGTTSVYDYSGVNGTKALISAENQENIGIAGKGVIEGQGEAVLNSINIQIQKGYLKETKAQASPVLVCFDGCSNVSIEQINLWNACGNVQSYKGCNNIIVSKVSVKSKVVADSKGVLLSGCDGVKLSDIFFDTSGAELTSVGKSKNVSVINCINTSGKKIQANQ